MFNLKIERKIEKYKKLLYIISPSYWLYDSLKIKVKLSEEGCLHDSIKIKEELSGEDKIKNDNIVNLMKYFYLALSVFIFSLFSIYDAKNRIINNMKVEQSDLFFSVIYDLLFSGISNLLFIIIMVVIPLLIVWYLLNKSKVTFEKIKDYIEKNNKFKFYMFKHIKFIYIVIIVCYLIILSDESKLFWIKFIGIIVIILFYGVSRPVHFALVFIKDIVKKLEKDERRDISGKIRLIFLCIGSYLNIIIDYSILFYSLRIFGVKYLGNLSMFGNDINSILDMMYCTIGYENLIANNYIIKIFIIIMMISITILITGNLAVYLNIKDGNNIEVNDNYDYYI